MEPSAGVGRGDRWLRGVVGLVLLVLAVFVSLRLVEDVPHLVAGTPGEDPFGRRYVEHPWEGYLHIVPGALFLALALVQLSVRVRRRHLGLHRRLGRIAVALGLVSAVFGLVFGARYAFGGAPQTAATLVFGAWFGATLVLGLRAARRHRIGEHRRWMVRAFAVSTGVGTIRMWVGLLLGTGLTDFPGAFGWAFWLGLTMHVLAGELYLRHRPDLPRVRRVAPRVGPAGPATGATGGPGARRRTTGPRS